MKKFLFFSIGLLHLYTGCHSVQDNPDAQVKITDTSNAVSTPPADNMYKMEYKVDKYTFFIECDNRENATVHLYTRGMEHDYDETMKLEGQVLGSFMLDLDKNGFKEYYVLTTPTDDSGNINLMAFASNNGKSISAIYVDDTQLSRAAHTDTVFVDNGSLTRRFMHNENAVTFSFILSKGEAGYILRAKQH